MVATSDPTAEEIESRQFVGRARERAAFGRWLGAEDPSILNVSGPGGVGKSTLLRAFARDAAAAGRRVVAVAGGSAGDLASTLGRSDLDAACAWLSEKRAVVLVDGLDEPAAAGDFAAAIAPRLTPDARLVIAGRRPLDVPVPRTGDGAVRLRPLALERLDPEETVELLARRGVRDPKLADQIRASCGGWPLALALAADLVTQFGIRRLRGAPEWRRALRELVEQLLDEAAEPALRTALEAGAVVRHFDEPLIAALVGAELSRDTFEALCRLSAVRPTERGLGLHDDVRKLVADELRWRDPERHAELRLRALDRLAERARRAPPAERERLLEERLFLWEHEIATTLLFGRDEPGEVWLEPLRRDDVDELVRLQRRWQAEVRPALGLVAADAPWDRERHDRWFRTVVEGPAARVRVARDRSGEALGYDVVLPLCEETVALARAHPVLTAAIDAYLALDATPPLRAAPADADVVFLAQLGLGAQLPEATRSALIRDLLSVLARGGACVCSLDLPEYRRLADALGFRPLPASEVEFRGAEYRGYALDLRRVGTEPWLHALLAGRRPPPVGPGELEAELRDVLAAWSDDARLAGSSLAGLAGSAATADGVRSLVRRGLDRARASASASERDALAALELAYLERSVSHERAADRLHVSRATFYRLLRRGTDILAAALPGAAAAPPETAARSATATEPSDRAHGGI